MYALQHNLQIIVINISGGGSSSSIIHLYYY